MKTIIPCMTCTQLVSLGQMYYELFEDGTAWGGCINCANRRRKIRELAPGSKFTFSALHGEIVTFPQGISLNTVEACKKLYSAIKSFDRPTNCLIPDFGTPSIQTTDKPIRKADKAVTKKLFSSQDEIDGATVRQEQFDIEQFGSVVARCVVAISKRDGEDPQLHYVIAPTQDYGFDGTKEQTFYGAFARKFAEFIAAARPYLGGSDQFDSDHDIHIELDI